MPTDTLPEWEQVLSAAAHLQRILPGAILVGGSAAAVYAEHRLSTDADHVLADLEAVAGWRTARVRRPVQILGSLDGIETGVKQLIRQEPLEITQIDYRGERITLPTEAEMLRIKAVLILQRNATRDYLDFVALAAHLGDEGAAVALQPFDQLYPQPNEESALQQLQIQLANPLPYDLEGLDLSEYKYLHARWHDWSAVRAGCVHYSILIFDRIIGLGGAISV